MLAGHLEHVVRALEHANMLTRCVGHVIRALEHANSVTNIIHRRSARNALARNTVNLLDICAVK